MSSLDYKVESIREEGGRHLSNSFSMVAKRPDQGLPTAFWDYRGDGRRGEQLKQADQEGPGETG